MATMAHQISAPVPAEPGDKVALLSPAWAAPAYFPEVHRQAVSRMEELLNVEVVEYPTTAAMNASPADRARDFNAALADPQIRAIFTTMGGDDQIRITRFLDPVLARRDPKPVFGYSDNTNILNWLWRNGIASYHGGASMVHFGSGPGVDSEHLATVRAALFGQEDLPLPMPEDSEDYGWDWSTPQALTEPVRRESAIPLEFIGPDALVRGRTWGGCMEVIDQLALADRLPAARELEGAILLLETSEMLPPPDYVGRWVRAMGERGYLDAAAGLVFARPVVRNREMPDEPEAVVTARREAYTEYLLSNIVDYTRDLLVCIGLPFGHTRPQLVLPYGGEITLDPSAGAVIAHFASV